MTQTTQTPKKQPSKALATGLGVAFGLAAIAGAFWLWNRAPQESVEAPAVQTPASAGVPVAKAATEVVPVAAPEPVDPAVLRLEAARELIEASILRYEKLKGYQAIFDTTEINDEGEWEHETSFFKFEKDFTLYMGFTEGKKKGMELLYAQDKFNDDIHVRMPGFLFKIVPPIAISPDDPRVRGKNKHSIRSAGIGRFLEEFGESFHGADQAGKIRILAIEDVLVHGEKGTLVDVDYGMPYEYPRTSVAFSKSTGLPLEVKLYKDQKEIVETYRYLQLVVDPERSSSEFTASADPRLVEKFQEAASS